jgi:uncharacterized membrane-anchored protein
MHKAIKYMLPELFDEDKAFTGGLPKVTRFQILTVLATMWAFIFALMTQNFISFGINVTTSIIAHILVIGGIIFTRKRLNINYRFNTYHSMGRSRSGMIGLDGSKVKFDKDDPGGEHE